jgi:putative glutathione S-transferase
VSVVPGRGHGVPIRFASPIDAANFGEHRAGSPSTPLSSIHGFSDRITADGSSGYRAEPGRYHVYAGRFCPRSHRAVITLTFTGLINTGFDVLTVSFVDGMRDGRGWAFRERTGPDPINGFTLLREAYEASTPGYDGNISIPVLWDRRRNRIVSNNADTIDVDLATVFRSWAGPAAELYPEANREQIDCVSRTIAALDRTINRAVYHQVARDELVAMLRDLDRRLAGNRYLLGDVLTLADVRLWVLLVRYDAGPNAHGAAGPTLTHYPSLWAYARDLYAQPAFRATTDFAAFTAPLTPLPNWTEPVRTAVNA